MVRLIPFELSRIWRKRSFVLSIGVLLLLHLFLMWYTSIPNQEMPSLSAYRAIRAELSLKSESEKESYIIKLKENIDGICFVRDIIAIKSYENEMGKILAEQKLQNSPGVFEKYYDIYQSGNYLKFTGSLEQEQAFINEIYDEWQKVSGYGEYLKSIQENADILSGISIFGGQAGDTYSSRNLNKSAADYKDLNAQNIRFTPSKGITSAMESIWTDLLLFLGVMLFVGSLITEEKGKRLFLITRSTRHGVMHSIMSKIIALLIHCILLTGLFYAVSLVFFGSSTGGYDFSAGLQSVASYTESCLPISILGYILLSVLTKAFVLFGIGTMLTVFCILFQIAALPFLVGVGIIGISTLLYYLIPAGSAFSAFKYINPVGLMKTENLYGGYLNFNLFGYPVSRLCISLMVIFLICVIGIGISLWLFCRMGSLETRKLQVKLSIPFRPHTNILRHEGYKIMVTNHALLIFLLFAALLTYKSLERTYMPSVGEQYYQNIMTELEGELTDEKEAIVLSEKERYEEALYKIEQLDEMAGKGEISTDVADSLKAQANITLAFYPFFQRVEEQYEHIKADGGSFVYDTGYLYLLGILEESFSGDFLILSIGILLGASGAAAMEYQNNSLFLICTTKSGKRKIMIRKVLICSIMAAVLALVPIICRICRIALVYPMHSINTSVCNISYLKEFAVPMPISCLILIFAFSQLLSSVIVAILTMAISVWRKNQAQTIFFALLFLVVPMILKLLGFEVAKWFSLYPLYGWTGMM